MQEQDVEARRHAARRLGEPLAIDLGCTYERGAARQSPTAFDHEIAFTHGAQLAHQLERAVILDIDGLAVGHRQREAGALQQARRVR